MSDWVIKCEGISKRFRINNSERYDVRKSAQSIMAALHLTEASPQVKGRWFWALKDVSFTVDRGEILGLIGANGAGKSTLLRILTRLTEPTEGRAEIRGRVGSLLEVGTGFNLDLTGRENIFLSGALLGMSEQEIRKSFDEIVAYTEIEQFIDTQVKHYSSGMYMRLAFSVAAHLRTEILLVDEVLAVGDMAFQRKCLKTMDKLARDGRTVIFVSHSTDTLMRLCGRALLIERGCLVEEGPATSVVNTYLSKVNLQLHNDLTSLTRREGLGQVRFLKTWVEDERGEVTTRLRAGNPGRIVASFASIPGAPRELLFGASIYASNGRWLTDLTNYFFDATTFERLPARGRVEFTLPNIVLSPGRYQYNLIVRSSRVGRDLQDWLMGVGAFDVIATQREAGESYIVVDHGMEIIEEQPA
jgi:lipopolysaccharide transport system ATP-binding protein